MTVLCMCNFQATPLSILLTLVVVVPAAETRGSPSQPRLRECCSSRARSAGVSNRPSVHTHELTMLILVDD